MSTSIVYFHNRQADSIFLNPNSTTVLCKIQSKGKKRIKIIQHSQIFNKSRKMHELFKYKYGSEYLFFCTLTIEWPKFCMVNVIKSTFFNPIVRMGLTKLLIFKIKYVFARLIYQLQW